LERGPRSKESLARIGDERKPGRERGEKKPPGRGVTDYLGWEAVGVRGGGGIKKSAGSGFY